MNCSELIYDNICKNLTETFNTSILNEKEEVKNYFYQVANDNENEYTIYKLIKNNENKQEKIIVNNIGGPYILRHLFNKELKMELYLFGERHSDEIDCTEDYIPFENYLENVINKTDVFLDIYLEVFPFDQDTGKYNQNDYNNDRISKILEKTYECIQPTTRDKQKCKLSRIHYIDIRKKTNKFNEILLFFYYRNYIDYFENADIEDLKLMIEILEYFLDKDELKKYLKIQLINWSYIKSYLYKKTISIDLVKNIIKYFYEKMTIIVDKNMEKIKFFSDNLISYIKELIKIKKFEQSEEIEELEDFIKMKLQYIDTCKRIYNSIVDLYMIDIGTYYMDIYTIIRMFKKFNNLENQPTRAHNILHYAGSAHTKNIYEFLLINGFEELERDSVGDFDSKSNCIQMENVLQPLFSEWLFDL